MTCRRRGRPGIASRRSCADRQVSSVRNRLVVMLRCPEKRSACLVVALLVGSAVVAVGCGGGRPSPSSRSSSPGGSAGGSQRSTVRVQACGAPAADPALVRDRDLAGALRAGPLVVYPADDIARIPRAARGGVVGPKVVVITTGAKPVTLTVGRSARTRFSLLFAGATTGRPATGFRVADGIAAVRFPVCGRGPIGFRGGFLYRRAQCVPITVRADGGPTLRAKIAIGRPRASCPGALRPREG